MTQLFEFLKKDKETSYLLKACIFHYELEFIHPFQDGNGRMGRLWQSVILKDLSPVFAFLPVESIIKEEQLAYYKVLEKSDKSGNSTPFIEFALEAIDKALGEQLNERRSPISALDRVQIFKEQVGKEGAYQGYVEDMQAKATTAAENARMFKAETDRLQRAYNTTGSATVKSQLEQARQKATYYEQSRLLAEQKASTTLEDFDLGEYMEIYQDKFATNMGNMYATQKVSKDLISNEYWKEARADARQARSFANEMAKEEYKQRLDNQKPENLLKRKKEVMDLAKVDQQDFYSVPMVFDPSIVNRDIDKLSVASIINDPGKVLSVTPAGPQKKTVETFLNYLRTIKDSDSYVVELKNGQTTLVTGENIKELYVSDLDTIKGIAKSNTVETYSGRRKNSFSF